MAAIANGGGSTDFARNNEFAVSVRSRVYPSARYELVIELCVIIMFVCSIERYLNKEFIFFFIKFDLFQKSL